MNEPQLSPERRAAMRKQVLEYVDHHKRRRTRRALAGIGVVATVSLGLAVVVLIATQGSTGRVGVVLHDAQHARSAL
ncbi:hypothetical protein E3O25_09685 [Cryobacterium sp. TMT1-3]|uniref:Uncharacterized protein n=1 Tax=Cryobacterium luteum TaxID=1424661 RepID=A0A1H8CBK8_9MICO|nr:MULTISPECIES: hypothetical protein [Cryobacterium]TFB89318.1 hypothetical protein E3O10_10660 [Cryobacterium luteum]TFC27372.1 hypothetical protein E3O25_09685 [Cryobacterium sp. TMT1-3]SEM92400.1 hypothetical protein SAMN05216281_102327 [Cryobacterium luteum]